MFINQDRIFKTRENINNEQEHNNFVKRATHLRFNKMKSSRVKD